MNRKYTALILLVALVLLGFLALVGPGGTVFAQTGDGFDLSWHVMGGGGAGGPMTGDGFSMRSTIAQTGIGLLAEGDYTLGAGYWYSAGGALIGYDVFLPLLFNDAMP